VGCPDLPVRLRVLALVTCLVTCLLARCTLARLHSAMDVGRKSPRPNRDLTRLEHKRDTSSWTQAGAAKSTGLVCLNLLRLSG
jgi:hypothetical protein